MAKLNSFQLFPYTWNLELKIEFSQFSFCYNCHYIQSVQLYYSLRYTTLPFFMFRLNK